MRDPDGAPHRHFATGSPAVGGGQLILVIDDDEDVRAVLVDTLTSEGFRTLQASGGEEGLRLLEKETPAAAIIDFLMPGMNGAEAAKRLRERAPNLPIIFVSGYFDTLALDGVDNAGVLRKPFNAGDLKSAMSLALA